MSRYLSVLPLWLTVPYAGLFAASLASFLAVVGERLPARRSLNGRSRCICGRPLTARDLVPLVSFAAQRGKARCCGGTIPVRLFLVEAGAAAAGVVTVLTAGAAWPFVVVALAATVVLSWGR